MARGENAEKRGHPGKELWGKRYGNPQTPGKDAKKVTHRHERHIEAREEIEEQLHDG